MNYLCDANAAANSAYRKTNAAWNHGFNWGAAIGVMCGSAIVGLAWAIVERISGMTP